MNTCMLYMANISFSVYGTYSNKDTNLPCAYQSSQALNACIGIKWWHKVNICVNLNNYEHFLIKRVHNASGNMRIKLIFFVLRNYFHNLETATEADNSIFFITNVRQSIGRKWSNFFSGHSVNGLDDRKSVKLWNAQILGFLSNT